MATRGASDRGTGSQPIFTSINALQDVEKSVQKYCCVAVKVWTTPDLVSHGTSVYHARGQPLDDVASGKKEVLTINIASQNLHAPDIHNGDVVVLLNFNFLANGGQLWSRRGARVVIFRQEANKIIRHVCRGQNMEVVSVPQSLLDLIEFSPGLKAKISEAMSALPPSEKSPLMRPASKRTAYERIDTSKRLRLRPAPTSESELERNESGEEAQAPPPVSAKQFASLRATIIKETRQELLEQLRNEMCAPMLSLRDQTQDALKSMWQNLQYALDQVMATVQSELGREVREAANNLAANIPNDLDALTAKISQMGANVELQEEWLEQASALKFRVRELGADIQELKERVGNLESLMRPSEDTSFVINTQAAVPPASPNSE